MNLLRKTGLHCSTLLLFLAWLGPIPINAQSNAGSGSGLSVSPTRYEYTIDPGKAEKLSFTIKNVTDATVIARATVNDFESDNTSGEPRILLDQNQKTASSVKPFLSGLDDLTLQAGEKKTLDVFAQIPADYPPGAYFGIVRFVAIPANREAGAPNQVALTASVGSLVLIQVPGNIIEKIKLKNIQIINGDTSRRFFTSAPDSIAVTVTNEGNGFAKPFGKVTVTGPGGEAFNYEMNNTNPRSNILPNSTRVFKDPVKKLTRPGRYTAAANISSGQGGEVLVVKTSFWYIPRWFMIAIVVTIAVLCSLVIYFFQKRKGHKSHRK